MGKTSGGLTLIQGNKRRQNRSLQPSKNVVSILFGKRPKIKGTIRDLNFSTVTLDLLDSSGWEDLLINESGLFELADANGVMVDGLWKVKSLRRESSSFVVEMEHSEVDLIELFQDLVTPEIVHVRSRFKVFNLSHDSDRQEFASHLTDLKDFPIKVQCSLNLGSTKCPCFFDFSGQLKEITELNFTPEAALPKAMAGTEVSLEYNFLGVRYILKTALIEVDTDFNLIAVELPSVILSTSARRFDRFPCHFPIEMKNDEGRWEGTISAISAYGFTVQLKENREFPTDDVTVSLSDPKINFRAIPMRNKGNILILKFASDYENKITVLSLIAKVLPEPLITREPSNYEIFLDLYRAAGYSPSESEKLKGWQEGNKAIWKQQDSKLCGTCYGALDGEIIVGAIGVLPYSRRSVYTHSLGMIKTVKSASAVLRMLTYSLAWTELLPDIQIFSTSHASAAKFVTRFYIWFVNQPRPERQRIVNVVRLFPGEYKSKSEAKFQIELVESIDALPETTEINKFLFQILGEPNKMMAEFHKVKIHLVSDSKNNPIAIMFEQNTPDYYTAANVYQYVWLFSLNADSQLNDLLLHLREIPNFQNRTIQVVGEEKTLPPFTYGDRVVPAFWLYTDKEELGPLIGSISRSVYTVLRKYGEEGVEEISKTLSGT